MNRFVLSCAVSVGLILSPVFAHAHSGGTDRYGCHGGSRPYHCHGGGSSSSSGGSSRGGSYDSHQESGGDEGAIVGVAIAAVVVVGLVFILAATSKPRASRAGWDEDKKALDAWVDEDSSGASFSIRF